MTIRSLTVAVVVLLVAAIVLSSYAWHMRGHAQPQTPETEVQSVAPPPTGTTEQVTLYVAYDNPGVVLPENITVPLPEGPQQRAQAILRALIRRYTDTNSPHPLAPASDVRDVYFVPPGLAVVDFNSDLANGHRSGILVEELTLVSTVQTLTAAIPSITQVKFLVDGKERETLAGHADLMEVYDVNRVTQMADTLRKSQ